MQSGLEDNLNREHAIWFLFQNHGVEYHKLFVLGVLRVFLTVWDNSTANPHSFVYLASESSNVRLWEDGIFLLLNLYFPLVTT